MAQACRLILRFLLVISLSVHLSWAGKRNPSVGIIGGGIGGTSVAYFLKELLPSAEVDIFEKSGLLGGRLNVTMVFGNGYETGGSIIHSRNKYAVNLAKTFGLQEREDNGEALSIIKGDEFVFNTSKWTIITVINTLMRYGFNFNKFESLVSGFLDKFVRIYDYQEQGRTFETPLEMLESLDPLLRNLTNMEFRKVLEEHGLAENFIDEMVQAITFVNYGQDLKMHGFVGSVAGAGAGSALWAVNKGNRQIPEKLAEQSKARVHLKATVKVITKQEDGKYRLSDENNNDLGVFDHIVIAIPLDASEHLTFNGFPSPPYDYPQSRKYHRTVATIVAGWPHEKYKFRSHILSCVQNWYNSISLIHPTILLIAEKYPVYKIFSPKPLTEAQLDSIFSERHYIEVHDWLAYPEYDEIPPKVPGFILAPNLFYLNAVEWTASAMEMSLISGKNIALLITEEQNKL